jgi:hypothetical protein
MRLWRTSGSCDDGAQRFGDTPNAELVMPKEEIHHGEHREPRSMHGGSLHGGSMHPGSIPDRWRRISARTSFSPVSPCVTVVLGVLCVEKLSLSIRRLCRQLDQAAWQYAEHRGTRSQTDHRAVHALSVRGHYRLVVYVARNNTLNPRRQPLPWRQCGPPVPVPGSQTPLPASHGARRR